MFMRLFHIKISVANTEEFEEFYYKSVFPALKNYEGCLFAGLVKNERNVGEFISLSLWENQKRAQSYTKSGIYQKLVQKLEPMLAYSTEWKIQLSAGSELQYTPLPRKPRLKHFNVAVRYDPDEAAPKHRDNMIVRIVSLKIKKEKYREMKNIYEKEILPVLEKTEGCCCAYLIENISEQNEVISLTTWENQSFASQYEESGQFQNLLDKLKHTLTGWNIELDENREKEKNQENNVSVSYFHMVTGEKFD